MCLLISYAGNVPCSLVKIYCNMLLKRILITETQKDLFVSCGVMNLHLTYISLLDDKNIFQTEVKLIHNVGHDKLNMLQLIHFGLYFLFLKLMTIMFKSDIFNVLK